MTAAPTPNEGLSAAPIVRFAIAVLVLATALACPAFAAEADERGTRFYTSGIIGGSWATFDAGGTNDLAGADNTGSAEDTSIMGGGAVGTILALGPFDLRLEIEAIGGRKFEYTLPSPGGSGTYAVSSNVVTLQGNFWFAYPLANLAPNLFIVNKLEVFGGGGLGLSAHDLSASDGAVSGSNRDQTLAWQGGFGLSYVVSESVAIDLRYSYIDMGGATIDLSNGAGGQGELETDIGGNEIFGGVRFTFGGP